MGVPTLEGVAALTRQLKELGSLEDGKALRRAVRAGIKPAQKRAISLIPKGTVPHRLYNGLLVAPGYAATAIRSISTINSAKNIASGILGVRKGAYYAVNFITFGIFGTRRKAANPWLQNALLDSRNECEEAFRESLRKSVEKAAKTK